MQAWENFLLIQETELGVETVKKWLRSLKIVQFDACNLFLEASDSFQISWFEEHIRKKAYATLMNNNGKRIKIHLSLGGSSSSTTLSSKKNNKTANAKKQKNELPAQPQFQLTFDSLNPLFTFANFVVSKANPIPGKLFLQITGKDQEPDHHALVPKTELASFNPLYLYGPNGAGKTHLLMAAAEALRISGLSVVYVRAETFTDHVVTAIRAGEMSMFRQGYRNIDVLIIDDVQVFSRKWATQEELFHTFNTLHTAGKQIILSADCSPAELQFIEPRLVSRFEWGIVLPMVASEKEEAKEILLKKAAAFDFHLHSTIIDFLLETFTRNNKSLTKALEALILRMHLKQGTGLHISSTQLTVPLARNILADLIREEHSQMITSEKIIQQTAEFFGIRPEDILGKAQSRECVLPRQIAMNLCRTQLKLPYMKIGDLFARDHSTVMSSVKYIQKEIDANHSDIVNAISVIIKKLKE